MRTEISHFWLGKFKSEDECFDFVGEDNTYYEEDDIEEKYISEFAKSQGEIFLDHDFMESGFENEAVSFEEKFSKYSYADQWIAEVKNRLHDQKQNLEDINTLVFISKDQIEKPVSVMNSKFDLLYIGEIEYNI
ncbi:immunity 22 family protein [Flavobacterium piscisymbiosum]|uniref:Immunity 22 family protein n=1 Tax=Flavobacterium piscisymbiosum TaxID=2893753 RepID=A0ABS8MB94_9FLAO|nr:immunity 22 family protein [Flavobacterium sp. F-30]MCC9062796.1 immunity 22 family protein [Flavobacterium sp. F-30]